MWNDKKVEISIDTFSNAKISKKEVYFFIYKKTFMVQYIPTKVPGCALKLTLSNV